MAYDELGRLLGTTGVPTETITATANGTAIFVGAGRNLIAELRVPGPVTGTTPTLDIKIQESADSAFTTPIDLVSFPQQTAAMLSGGGAVPGSAVLRRSFTTSKPYLRAVKTIGGTSSPTFTSVSLELLPGEGLIA